MDFFNRTQALAVWLGGISSLVLMLVAWIQLRAIRATSRADFIQRLSQRFFTDKTSALLRVLDDQRPCFDENGGHPKFVVDGHTTFTVDQLDDHLLGPLEDVGIFENLGAVELNAVYDVFAYFINRVWEDPEIQKYIVWSRKQPDGWDLYERLESIYVKCAAYGKQKEYLDRIWTSEIDFDQS